MLDHNLPTSNKKIQIQTQKKEEKNLYILTFNVRTLRTDAHLIQLENALEKIKWHILGISEFRRIGEEIIDFGQYILYHKGETKGMFGVGFLIKSELKNNIEEFIGVSERIAMLNIRLPEFKESFSIIQIYAPTEVSTNEDKDNFYEQLNNTVRRAHKRMILMGDFNSTLGPDIQNKVTGKFSTGKRNDNGERLIQFALEHNIYIANTFFKKSFNKKWTYLSPLGLKDERDFILTSNNRMIRNVETINNFNFDSDHRIVRCEISTSKYKSPRRHITNNKVKISLPIPEIIQNELDIALKEMGKNNNIQEKYNLLVTSLQNINTKFSSITKKKDRLGKEAKILISQRQQLLQDKQKHRKEITKISKQINESIRKHRKKNRLQTIQEHIEKSGGVKKAIQELTEGNLWIPALKDKKQKSITKRQDMMKIATEFYKNLYDHEDEENIKSIELFKDNEGAPKFLKCEIENAISSQKNNKTPGEDNITNELLKGTLNTIALPVMDLFNEILEKEQIPEQWTKTTITLIHKKGDKHQINNYRPVSLMSNIYKVFSKLILGRINKTLEENQPPEQAGFRKNFSTIDHILVIKQITEKYNEYGKKYYIAFVDYNKAFDSIKHEVIWNSLWQQGVSAKYIRIIRNIYSNSYAKLRLEKTGEEFRIKKGVRQGDPLSPKIFTAVLETIMREMNWEEYGLNINGKRLHHLRFADDLILLAENPETLKTMLLDLDTQSRVVGLTMNTQKTKLMTNSEKYEIEINGNNIEYVNEYEYLGQTISPYDQTNKEIDKRIEKAWKRYWSLKEIMKAREIPTKDKIKVLNMCVIPIITYGCQSWALTQKNWKRLEVCQNSLERSILNIKLKDKIRLSTIKHKLKTNTISSIIRKQKWRWTGHMIRQKTEKWTKNIVEWYPRDGKRRRGRPYYRWEDDLKEVAGKIWMRAARDRRTWKKLEEAYVDGQVGSKIAVSRTQLNT